MFPAMAYISSPERNAKTVAVIGGGVVGSAVAYNLARRNVRTTLYEQFKFLHANASSAGGPRVSRLANFEEKKNPNACLTETAVLTALTYQKWQQDSRIRDHLEKLGLPGWIYKKNGTLITGTAGTINIETHGVTNPLEETLIAARAFNRASAFEMNGKPYKIDFKELSAKDVMKRWPQFIIDPSHRAYWERESGVIMSVSAVAAQLYMARMMGATLCDETKIADVSKDGKQYRVTAADGEFSFFDDVVITAGPWVNDFLPKTMQKPRVMPQFYGLFEHKNPAAFSPENTPNYIIFRDDGYMYGFPAMAGASQDTNKPLVKLAQETTYTTNKYEKKVPRNGKKKLGEFARVSIPGLVLENSEAHACSYTDSIVAQTDKGLVFSKCWGGEFKHGFGDAVAIAAHVATDGKDESFVKMFTPVPAFG